ncbi:uncharacterized protein LOC126484159 isoform X1 [Schistocerca serialis cubense]|uniref:uncharacterized protein LOC126484159 isoform X1 n=1 Tax=Schistocerca serialis cubense TaxID=2023355 RepID=UPI00214EACBE|nr:uncharacterized protein LOC126484159 isoform X1 [Schistocerca serialis cubense]
MQTNIMLTTHLTFTLPATWSASVAPSVKRQQFLQQTLMTAAEKLAAVPDVDIDPEGTFKYVLIGVFGPEGPDGKEPSKLVVVIFDIAAFENGAGCCALFPIGVFLCDQNWRQTIHLNVSTRRSPKWRQIERPAPGERSTRREALATRHFHFYLNVHCCC